MNSILRKCAIDYLKSKLPLLPESNQKIFKLMYGCHKYHKTAEEKEALDLMYVIDNMPDEKLNWAMQQVENSLNKLNK